MYKELREVWNEFTGPGGPFEVVEVDVRGIRLKAYACAAPSLREVWLASRPHAEKDYLVYGDERWTYADAHRDVASIGNWLVDRGVGPGDRVGIGMRNYPEWMLAYWATVSIGAAAVGLNAWWTGPEMIYGIGDATPKVTIFDSERLERWEPHRGETDAGQIVAVRVEGALPEGVIPWSELLARGGELPEVTIDPDSDASIFYTSGTTGHPKGAQLTHRGCVNNLMSLAFWNVAAAAATQRAGRSRPAPEGTVSHPFSALVTTPLFHVTANNCVAQSATLAGGKLVHMYKWDPSEALELIEREHITNMSGVPVMARELLAHPDFEKTDTSSLTSLGGGGAPLQPDLVEKIDSTVATARPGTGYGMTEVCGIITANGNEFFIDKPESAGPAMPVFDCKCIDVDGNDLPVGEVGELCVKGAQVIRGYLNRPEATAEAIVDGWLRTGDIARIDEDGFIFIVDRAKDMVLRGGENVYCAEVEAALFEHEAVAECAVFGVPDDRLGEEVAAAIVLAEGASPSADDLRAHCAERIAKYKIPRYIWLRREPLPRNASGKFLKKDLRDVLDPADAA
ncbi:MAG: AMP-dependent synthetase [Deltaproteobacteria bacterium]|nr:AMP-dependent synthetase [Deltaproteobacteria bacterium]